MLSQIEVNKIINEAVSTVENQWIEWKHNNYKPDDIGEYISCLANSAPLHNRHSGYLIWGINDNREIVGTDFDPLTAKHGNQELENWLLTLLKPQIHFEFSKVIYKDLPLVILEIDAAKAVPIRFRDVAYIRVGSYKKKLRDHQDIEKRLWQVFETIPPDESIVKTGVTSDDVLRLLNYERYFQLLNQPIPENKQMIIDRFLHEKIINDNEKGEFNITLTGAILLCRSFSNFPKLQRKEIRIVLYSGDNRVKAKNSTDIVEGYATSFSGLIKYIRDLLPYNETL